MMSFQTECILSRVIVVHEMVFPSSFKKDDAIYALSHYLEGTYRVWCTCHSSTNPQAILNAGVGAYTVITDNLVGPFLNGGLGYLLRNAKHGFLAYLEKKIFPFSN